MADAVTSDLVYVRRTVTPGVRQRLLDAALDSWADRCRGWAERADVVAHASTTTRGPCAPDALRLIGESGPEAGLWR